jgi:hypothetical protein
MSKKKPTFVSIRNNLNHQPVLTCFMEKLLRLGISGFAAERRAGSGKST